MVEELIKQHDSSDEDDAKENDNVQSIDIENTPIHMLNDDCLLEVFRKLPLKDVIRIERVCKRWQNLSQQARSRLTNVTLYLWLYSYINDNVSCTIIYSEGSTEKGLRGINDQSVEKFFMCCGHLLIRLTLRNLNLRFNMRKLTFIIEQCCNLTELVLHLHDRFFAYYGEAKLAKFLSQFRKLKYIRLTNIGLNFEGNCLRGLPRDTITEIHVERSTAYNRILRNNECEPPSESFFKIISEFPNLHTLGLKEFKLNEMTLNEFGKFKNVENFILTYCDISLNTSEWPKNLCSVKGLNLQGSRGINNRTLHYLSMNCLTLKSLNVAETDEVTDDGLAAIANLPHLETLNICYLKSVTGFWLSKMTNLRSLICAGCNCIGDPVLIALIESAENLRYLNLNYTTVTEATLIAANKITLHRNNDVILIIDVRDSLTAKFKDMRMNDHSVVHSPFLRLAVDRRQYDLDDYCATLPLSSKF